MTERIYFKRYDSAGKFPHGRIKLDVHFEDSQNNRYIWTPKWEATRNLRGRERKKWTKRN